MSESRAQRLIVKTTVTIPQFKTPGIKQNGRLYMALDDFAEWLDQTADVFDRAHAEKDIGGVLRACAAEARGAKDV